MAVTERIIRVVVANRPRLMREAVLTAIAGHPDIEVVKDVENEDDIEKVIEETNPDAVIVGLGPSDRLSDACYSILQRHPFLKIIGVAANRDSTVLYWALLNIHSERVETSEEGLLKALRRME
jgi:chemotaxis response regulator CheB